MAVDRLKSPYYISPPNTVIGSGGEESTLGAQKVHVFKSGGSFQLNADYARIEYLIVAGGVGGGGAGNVNSPNSGTPGTTNTGGGGGGGFGGLGGTGGPGIVIIQYPE